METCYDVDDDFEAYQQFEYPLPNSCMCLSRAIVPQILVGLAEVQS